MFLVEYMDSLTVTTADRVLLATRQPVLISRAIHRIFQGTAFHFTEAGVLLAISLAIAWTVLAAFGRAATVEAVIEDIELLRAKRQRAIIPSLLAINFLRAAVALAALAGVVGSTLIASSFWASTHVSAADSSRLFFLSLFFVWMAWVSLNWLLSVSAIFVVVDRTRALSAIGEAVRLCQQEPGALLSTGALFGIVHLGAFVAASGVGFMIFGALGSLPAGLVWLAQVVLIFLYCAGADFLYTARVAAYVSIIRREELHTRSTSVELSPLSSGGIVASVDPDELILSDVPLPAS